MPQRSLELLMEYNQERLVEQMNCCAEVDPENPPKEVAFIQLAKILAGHEQIVPHLLPMLADPDISVAQKQMVFYLLLSGEDGRQQQQALASHYRNGTPPFDLLPALALLDEDHQQKALTRLAMLKTQTACETVARHFLVNPGVETFALLFVDAQGRQCYTGGVFDKLAAQIGMMQTLQELNIRFKTAPDNDKLHLAKCLISTTHNREAKSWLFSADGLISDRSISFALLSGPTAYEQLYALAQLPLEEEIMLAITENLQWYGNPWSIPFLLWGIGHESPRVQHAFHRLLMAFFDEDDELLFKGRLLLEETILQQADYQARLQQFWEDKKNYINHRLSWQRYFQSDAFDIKRLFEDYMDTRSLYQLDGHTSFCQFLEYLHLWTGQRFYCDENALLSKQYRQVQFIHKWLETNAFEPGRWLCLGSYLDSEEPKSIYQK